MLLFPKMKTSKAMTEFHVGMTCAQARECESLGMRDLQKIDNILEMEPITHEEIKALDIPEGSAYTPWRGYYQGSPCSGRKVKTRQGTDVVVDVRFNEQNLLDLRAIVLQSLGELFAFEQRSRYA